MMDLLFMPLHNTLGPSVQCTCLSISTELLVEKKNGGTGLTVTWENKKYLVILRYPKH